MGNFPGSFISTVCPQVLSTGVMGNVIIEFRLAPNDVLVSLPRAKEIKATGEDGAVQTWSVADVELDKPVNPRYELNHVALVVNTIDIADNRFYEFLSAEAQRGMDCPFLHYTAQPGALTAVGEFTQTVRATVSSNSINKVIGTLVPEDMRSMKLHPGQRAIRPTSFMGADGAIDVDKDLNGSYGNAGTSRYFQRGSLDASKKVRSQYSVNNVSLHYPMAMPDIWNTVCDTFGSTAAWPASTPASSRSSTSGRPSSPRRCSSTSARAAWTPTRPRASPPA